MAFCSQCGKGIQENDVFCAACGVRQGGAPRRAPDPLGALTPHTAAILCYLPFAGWIAAVVVLAAEKFRQDRRVRFHAFQGLYLFVAWLLIDQVLTPMFHAVPGPFRFDKFLQVGLIALWVFMMVKAGDDPPYSLPVVGDLAERSVSER